MSEDDYTVEDAVETLEDAVFDSVSELVADLKVQLDAFFDPYEERFEEVLEDFESEMGEKALAYMITGAISVVRRTLKVADDLNGAE